MDKPFVVIAGPRCRTFWLQQYLSYGGWACGHDEIIRARTLDDVRAWLSMEQTGTVETCAAPWWRILQDLCPDVNVVLVRRPIDEMLDSLGRAGAVGDSALMRRVLERQNRKMDQIEARMKNVLSTTFESLRVVASRRNIFEFCLPFQFDHNWDAEMEATNIQVGLPQQSRYYEAHRTQIERLTSIARWRSINIIGRRALPDIDGVTIAEESFDDWLRDSVVPLSEHCVIADQLPDHHMRMDMDRYREIADRGDLITLVARSNGRIFGYLLTIISPSLFKRGVVSGISTVFYAADGFPRLGSRLQAQTVEILKERGVDEAFGRTGTHESGPKLASIWKRMGAEPIGDVYHLKLSEAA